MQKGAQAPVKPGEVIDGKYRVERVLGHGGMAVVVAARHLELDELVALKILHPHHAEKEDVRVRFAREARAAVKIKSEHVARVSDVGQLAGGTPYIVMEHLEGEDLASLLSRRTHVPATEAVMYVLQVCDALREAHDLGIVHRDVKPANLFLARTPGRPPRIKVLDFGISKLEETDRRCTGTKEILGSPWYMAPEQMQSARAADARSDIWSLGVILYELITGEVPFDGDTITEVIVHVLHEAPKLSTLPASLVPVIRRCLEKDPERRFANVEALASALRQLDRTVDDDGEVVDEAELIRTPAAPSVSDLVDDAFERDSTTAMTTVLDSRRTATLRPAPVAPSAALASSRTADRSKWIVAAATIPLGLAIGIVVATTRAKPTPARAPVSVSTAHVTSAPLSLPTSDEGTHPPPVAAPVEAQSHVMLPPAKVSSTPAVPATPATPAMSPVAPAVVAIGGDMLGLQIGRRHAASARECWLMSSKATSVAQVTIVYDESGAPATTTAFTNEPALSKCLEERARRWSHTDAAYKTVRVPLRFSR